jgi:hypothetical protein
VQLLELDPANQLPVGRESTVMKVSRAGHKKSA